MKYPVISTRGVVVFPRHSTTIEVGRKSSLNAIDLSIVQHGAKLILVSQRDIMKDNITSESDLYKVGTLVQIKINNELSSGSKTITAHGLHRVSLSKFNFNNGQLVEADATILKDVATSRVQETAAVNQISEILENLLDEMQSMPKSVLSSLATGISASDLADIIAHYLPISSKQKQIILEELDITKRLSKVMTFIRKKTDMSKIDKEIDSTVRKTLDNQQKEFLLRERLKAIKEELGEISSKDSEIDAWRKELQTDRFPKYVKEKALEEIAKFEGMPPISAEAHVSKGFIEWIFKLPWNTYTTDNQDLTKAKKMLDKNHFGLKEVKERIIEHLAVKINTKSSTAPIITFVGPPGVGKTSLAKSIADAVGRKFIKISLGGVRDEAEIRGHRRTYVGALPGKIIQSFNKAKSSNPVILLDEIDKMSNDYRGDPTSALLEVLDPQQNKNFQDHFLELEYDLSQVMFITTANYYERIPGPLLDRVELIFLDQYTSEEKLAIAKNYIIPKTIKENGLKKSEFKISDKVIAYIIDKYTAEAGVRGLERILAKLARKIVLKKVQGKIKGPFTITQAIARELLGKELVAKKPLEGKAEIGYANGMYYSAVGGGVLGIEVNTYPSKNGGFKLTGSIKDVMKESMEVAIGYLKAHRKEFGIGFDFENTMIQVHVPEGATPKDGPSAGIAFTTAILSALIGKPVPKDIAFTGEITLRGNVLKIGGLKQKTLGALEAGVKTFYIPKLNEQDIEELSPKVKKEAKIILVDNYSEIFKKVFK